MKTIYKPLVKILKNDDELDIFVSNIITEQLIQKPNSCITIATGNSTKKLFEHLTSLYKNGIVMFKDMKFFVLDEYLPTQQGSIVSTFTRISQQFIDHTDVRPKNVFYARGDTENREEEIKRYESDYNTYGPFDLSVVGIGPGKTCHIGLNEPGNDDTSGVHYQELDQESQAAMMRKLNLSESEVPKGGITLGMKNILESKKIVLIAKGKEKAWGIQRSLEGEISSVAPASFLRYNPHVIVALDPNSASLLTR